MAKNTIDMTRGPITKKLIIFALPLIATNVMQMFFNLADVAVLSAFIPDPVLADNAVAAVGSNSSLINLIISLFVGLSVGANVVVARGIGKGDAEGVSKSVGSAVFLSLIAGVFLAIVGICFSKTFLIWMDCDEEVLGLADTYMKIYFAGMPAIMLYNFTAAVLRADGDTFRPMLFITIGGIINVALNIFFVAVVGFDVEGVAIATVASQVFAGIACLIVLIKHKGNIKLNAKHFKLYREKVLDMVKIGLPSGIQSATFGISNVVSQSAINSFGASIMAANTIATQIMNVVMMIGSGLSVATLSFVSQNVGANNVDRVKKVTFFSSVIGFSAVTILGLITVIFASQISGILTSTPEVIQYSCLKIYTFAPMFGFCVLMDILGNVLKGLGKATTSMLIALTTNCLFRIAYIKIGFAVIGKNLMYLYWVWPISWALNAIVDIVFVFFAYKSFKLKVSAHEEANDNLI